MRLELDFLRLGLALAARAEGLDGEASRRARQVVSSLLGAAAGYELECYDWV